MNDFAFRLGRIEQEFLHEVARVQEVARAALPTGSPAWDALLEAYQLVPPDTAQRQAWSSELGLRRGACPGEVRAVLEVLAGRLAWVLDQLDGVEADDPESQSRIHQLRDRQRRLATEVGASYEASVLPRASAGLGGIFASANRTAPQPVPVPSGRRVQLTFKCRHCGAPQQSAREFTCAFCRQPLFG